ncbi:hypothetical protein D3C84_1200970 [compost metagenome]
MIWSAAMLVKEIVVNRVLIAKILMFFMMQSSRCLFDGRLLPPDVLNDAAA